MDSHIRAYWTERLDAGQIFFAPEKRQAGYDFRIKEGDTRAWPTYVAKEGLFGDYCAWAEKRVGAIRSMSELYRHLGPVLFIHGVDRHTRQLKADIPIHVGMGRILTGRKARAYIRMASLDVLRAAYRLQMGHGVASERREWGTIVKNSEQSFGGQTRQPRGAMV